MQILGIFFSKQLRKASFHNLLIDIKSKLINVESFFIHNTNKKLYVKLVSLQFYAFGIYMYVYIFSGTLFIRFSFKSQIIPLLSDVKIFRLYHTSKFLISLIHFFLKNPKFEIYPKIENKYAVYGFFLSFSIAFS